MRRLALKSAVAVALAALLVPGTAAAKDLGWVTLTSNGGPIAAEMSWPAFDRPKNFRIVFVTLGADRVLSPGSTVATECEGGRLTPPVFAEQPLERIPNGVTLKPRPKKAKRCSVYPNLVTEPLPVGASVNFSIFGKARSKKG